MSVRFDFADYRANLVWLQLINYVDTFKKQVGSSAAAVQTSREMCVFVIYVFGLCSILIDSHSVLLEGVITVSPTLVVPINEGSGNFNVHRRINFDSELWPAIDRLL